MRRTFGPLVILAAASILPLSAQPVPASGHSFRAERGQFFLDGKPVRIVSGEMHYARIPRAYWRDRLRMAKAMGLNAITTYVFWNAHEPRPGVYDFSGNLDVAEFVREAQQEGLYVILRPGPYSCAEWEFGGFPSWLLKDAKMVVRSRNPEFLLPPLLAAASGQGSGTLANRQRRTHHRRAGGERVRQLWRRSRLHAGHPPDARRCRVHQSATLHRGRR